MLVLLLLGQRLALPLVSRSLQSLLVALMLLLLLLLMLMLLLLLPALLLPVVVGSGRQRASARQSRSSLRLDRLQVSQQVISRIACSLRALSLPAATAAAAVVRLRTDGVWIIRATRPRVCEARRLSFLMFLPSLASGIDLPHIMLVCRANHLLLVWLLLLPSQLAAAAATAAATAARRRRLQQRRVGACSH